MNDKSSSSVAVITGASSGIGKACALEYARRGYSLVLAARRQEKLREVAEHCGQLGAQTAVVPTDVADEQQVRAMLQTACDRFGRLDVLINNAGYGIHGMVHELSDQHMRDIFNVNYFGLFYGCRHAAPIMIRQGGGHIFNVSSVIGKRGTPLNG